MSNRRPSDERRSSASPRGRKPDPPAEPSSLLESWLELTGSTGADLPVLDPSPEARRALFDLLHLALEDDFDELSMAPLGAGISQERWDDLPENERRAVQLRQLRAIDPRLLPNTVMNRKGLFSRDELFAEDLQAGS